MPEHTPILDKRLLLKNPSRIHQKDRVRVRQKDLAERAREDGKGTHRPAAGEIEEVVRVGEEAGDVDGANGARFGEGGLEVGEEGAVFEGQIGVAGVKDLDGQSAV